MNQLLGPAHLIAIGTAYSAGDRPENGVYLGMALILLLVFLVVRCVRDHLVVLGAGIGLTGLVLSFGTPLAVNGHPTHLALPFYALLNLSLVQGIAALRFSLYEQFGAAVVLGVGLDRVRRHGWAPRRRARCERESAGKIPLRRSATVGLVGLGALALLLPRFPYPSAPVSVPPYFTSAAVRAIPSASVVLTYPYDVDPDNDAMLWQAESGFRFKIFGGQATTPGPNGYASSSVASLEPGTMQRLFELAEHGSASGHLRFALGPSNLRSLRTFLVRYGVSTVVVDPIGAAPGLVLRGLTAALGRPPVSTGGMEVWYDADHRAAALLNHMDACCTILAGTSLP